MFQSIDGNTDDPNFDRRLNLITEGAQPFVKQHLLTRISRENCNIIISYIIAMQTEVNPRLRYKLETILKLKQLAEFHHPKSFEDMTRDDIIAFLDRLRKSDAKDPLHKWIGTYENNRIILLRFFKWLYAQRVEPGQRPKPEVMQNIRRIRRLEKEIYKPTDTWTYEEDLLFCKYCPSKRDRAYLRVARDTGCRAEEMVDMKIKDLVIQQTENGSHVVKVQVNGKTGTRNVRIYYGYPYLKDWLNVHPFPNVLNAPVFCGTGKKNTGRRIQPHTVWKIFDYYQKVYFPNY